MEGSVRSGHGVLKKKSSSGCLIIKKKDGASTMGMGSSSTASQQKLKKRPRLSDSESSDEELSQPIRRRGGDKFHNASVTSGGESREFARNIKGFESERKRSRLDLFDFDEYDEFHEEKQWRTNMMVAEKNTHSNTESLSGSRANKDEYGGVKKRHDVDEDEAHMPISLLRMKYKDSSQEPIRLQGKNGVLKVMVNNNKKIDVSRNKDSDLKSRRGSRSEDVVKKELLGRPFNSDTKCPEKRPLSMTTTEQSELKSQKRFLPKCSKSVDAEKDGTDTSLKLAPPSSKIRAAKEESSRSATKGATPANSKVGQLKRRGSMEKQQQIKPVSSKTRLIKGERSSIAAQDFTPAKSKETNLKRGGSTEKQQLRERIRGMLIEAGWTIDYRPRRNRDYLDAVYISPSRTAYWSIVKAYDALQKQSREDSGNSKVDSFAPLSNDLINKLTRQTRKKIEKEMKKKRKDDANFLKKRKDDARNRDYKQSTSSESSEDTDGEQSEERISSYLNIKKKGKFLKGKFHATDQDSDSDTSNSLKGGRVKQVMSGKSSIGAASSSVQGRKSGRCTLLVRRSDKEQDSDSDGFVPYTGKRTLLAWMIDSGTVKLSAKVQYMNRRGTRVKLQGWITRDGIHCACCSKILPVSKFELHAGSTLRQPFKNIMLESGISLLECLVDAWNRQEESQREDFHTVDVDGDDPDDDTCGICGDGGDLICCDGCPSTFHQSCLGIQMLPPGDWHCPNCTCKFCGTACTTAEDGEGAQDVLLYCSLCEKKYHKSCSLDINALPSSSNSPSVSFCGRECQQVYDHLQKILGVKHEIETGFSWSLIQRTDLDSNASPLQVECNSKLAVALAIMDECFLPIVDRKSGINIIHNVLYNCGSNFSRLNFRGFYTAILERGDEIISAASIRIHGTQLAEMPYIGTRNICRRQGMCRRLLSAIEMVLSSLKVEKLIIPAISEHMHTWTVGFGFNPLAQSEKLEMKSINMLVFPGTDMLQKRLLNGKTPGAGTNPQLPALVEKADQDTPTSSAGNLCDEACVDEVNEGVDAMDSDSPVTAMDLNVTGIIGAQSADCGYDTQISSKEGRSVKSNVQSELAESSTTSMPPSSSSGASIGYAGSGDAAFKKVGEGVDAMDSDSPVTSVDLNEQSADCGSDILISSKEGRSVKSNVQKELAKSSAKLMPSSSSGASIGNVDSKDVAFKKVNDSVDAVDSDSPATAMDLNDTGMIGVQTADCGYNMQISGEGRSVKSNVPKDVAESSTKSMPSSPSGAIIVNAGSVDAAFKKVNEGVDAMDSDSPATAVDLNGTGMIGVQTADCGHNIEISGKEGRSVKSTVLKELAESSAKSMPSSSSCASIENTGSGDAAFTKLDEGVDAIDSPATAVNLNDTGMVGAQSADCESDIQISSNEATSVKSNVEKELAELTTASIPSYPSGNTDLVNAALGPSTKVDAQSSDSPVTSVDLNEQGADCGPDIVIYSKEGISVKSNVQKKLAESSTKFMPSSSGASIENAGSGDAAFVKLDEGVDASDSPATAVGLNDTGMVGAQSADCGSDIQISSKVAISVKSNIEKELAELTTTSMPFSPSGASTGNTDLVNATLGPSTKVDAQSSEPVARLLCDQKAKTTTSSVFGIDISDDASARKINEEKQTEEISVTTSTDGRGLEPAAQSAIVDIKSSACVAATCAGENGLAVPSKQIANISLEGNLDASPINSLGEAYANAALENNTDYQLDSSCEAKVAVETL